MKKACLVSAVFLVLVLALVSHALAESPINIIKVPTDVEILSIDFAIDNIEGMPIHLLKIFSRKKDGSLVLYMDYRTGPASSFARFPKYLKVEPDPELKDRIEWVY